MAGQMRRSNEYPPTNEVLLLEDIGQIRAGFAAMLENSMPPVNVHEASSYEEAVDILLRIPIDFAFLDIDLSHSTPGQYNVAYRTGFDVLNYIRSNGLNTKAIMLSGYDNKESIFKSLDAGAWGYVVKTLNGRNVLREALETVLQDRIFLPPPFMYDRNNALPSTRHLTQRERELLYYIRLGDSYKVIAGKMGVEEGTVRDMGSFLYKKFGVKSKSMLMAKLAQLGIALPRPNPVADLCRDE